MSRARINGLISDVEGWNAGRMEEDDINLSHYSFYNLDLRGIDLHDVNLRGSSFYKSNLSCANFSGSCLYSADLERVNLTTGNLEGADLTHCFLKGANLTGTNLTGTVLDPTNKPNAEVGAFERDGDYVIGYRTKHSQHAGSLIYRVGECYTAPWFSTCPVTECHPGVYLCPSLEMLEIMYPDVEYVKVRARAADVHRAGDKWRAKEITVLEEAHYY